MMASVQLLFILILCSVTANAATAQAVVPTHTLQPGDIVSIEDVQITEASVRDGFSELVQVLGFEVRRVLYRGRPMRPGDVGVPALVERNELVTLVYRIGGLSIETEGRSLGRGAIGDKLNVLNLSSRNTVSGHVNELGAVIVGRE
ncbi:flagella basal body P-ring formation protein FlgA [Litoreibacter ascidiaceicola]|uniref:Flagella basal body P-ring formation protein FlgA n=1 Tax=Litoreibacter ascidiaceicola TaxID=1486859 RepID=A0A1M5ARK6_9RHOB|nr:flagellar basal body P-ring formation chaperone FlgA [Litoreibacter ascidiaceicola]SHF32883.1 flagella basal body P-ring formation protein FlgA [Litoreibacter ascidiaceicola]